MTEEKHNEKKRLEAAIAEQTKLVQELALQYQKLNSELQRERVKLNHLEFQLRTYGWYAVVKYQADKARIISLELGRIILVHPELGLVLHDVDDQCYLKILSNTVREGRIYDRDCDRLQRFDSFQVSLHRRREDAEGMAAKLQ